MVLLVGFPAVVSDISKYYSVPHSWRLIKDLYCRKFCCFYMILEGLWSLIIDHWSLIWFPCCCVSHFQVELSAALLASVLLEFYEGSLMSKVFLLFYMVLLTEYYLEISDTTLQGNQINDQWVVLSAPLLVSLPLQFHIVTVYLKVLVDGHWIQHAQS